MTNNECKGPFEGLLVIDMTHVLNGPFGTQLLCNMGARVIKVEPPGHGDDTRTFGPYVDGQSLYYSFINHGKESVVLDLKNDHDKSIFINMLKQADVLAENFGNDSNLLIVFYVQIMPDDFVMQLHRF
ncbi:Formyl-CoA transferase [Escherichia coli]